jgi:cell division protein FtsL
MMTVDQVKTRLYEIREQVSELDELIPLMREEHSNNPRADLDELLRERRALETALKLYIITKHNGR